MASITRTKKKKKKKRIRHKTRRKEPAPWDNDTNNCQNLDVIIEHQIRKSQEIRQVYNGIADPNNFCSKSKTRRKKAQKKKTKSQRPTRRVPTEWMDKLHNNNKKHIEYNKAIECAALNEFETPDVLPPPSRSSHVNLNIPSLEETSYQKWVESVQKGINVKLSNFDELVSGQNLIVKKELAKEVLIEMAKKIISLTLAMEDESTWRQPDQISERSQEIDEMTGNDLDPGENSDGQLTEIEAISMIQSMACAQREYASVQAMHKQWEMLSIACNVINEHQVQLKSIFKILALRKGKGRTRKENQRTLKKALYANIW